MNSMDDIFKKKLYDHEAEVPVDMWDNILAAQRDEKKKRRGLFIWLCCGALTLVGILGFIAWQLDYTNDSPTSSSTPKIEWNEYDDRSNNDRNDHQLTANNTNSTIDISNTTTTELNKTSQSTNTMLHLSDNNAAGTTYQKKHDYQNTAYRIKKKLDDLTIGNVTKQYSMPAVKLENNIPTNNNTPFFEKKEQNVKLWATAGLINPDFKKLELKPLDVSFPGMKMEVQRVDCPKFKRKKGALFVEGLYSANLNVKQLSSKSGSDGNAYLLKRLDSERALYSSSGGIRMGYQFPFGLSLASGAEYGQITERFSYEDLDAIKSKTVITFDTTFLSDGTYTTKADTFRIITHGSEVSQIVNRYRTLDIPVSLAYAIKGNRMDIMFKASALFNVYFQPSGKVLGINDKPIAIHNLDIEEGLMLKNRLNTRFDFALGLHYHLNNNLDLILEPYFKTSTGDLTRSSALLSQSYTTFGLRTGIKYILNQ